MINHLIDEITRIKSEQHGYPYALGYLKGMMKDLIGVSEERALEVVKTHYNHTVEASCLHHG